MAINVRLLIAILLLLLCGLQYRLWVGEGGFAQVAVIKAGIKQQKEDNARLEKRNQRLETQVIEFKKGLDSVEEHARNQLGLIKKGETFFLLAEDDSQ